MSKQEDKSKSMSLHNVTERHHAWLIHESNMLGTSMSGVIKNLIESEIRRTGWVNHIHGGEHETDKK